MISLSYRDFLLVSISTFFLSSVFFLLKLVLMRSFCATFFCYNQLNSVLVQIRIIFPNLYVFQVCVGAQ